MFSTSKILSNARIHNLLIKQVVLQVNQSFHVSFVSELSWRCIILVLTCGLVSDCTYFIVYAHNLLKRPLTIVELTLSVIMRTSVPATNGSLISLKNLSQLITNL